MYLQFIYSQFILTNNGREVWSLNGRFGKEFISGAYHAWDTAEGYAPPEGPDDDYRIMVRKDKVMLLMHLTILVAHLCCRNK